MIRIAFWVMLLVCIVLAAVLGAVISHLKVDVRLLKVQLDTVEKEKQMYAERAAMLSNARSAVSKNRKEADEKVNELHSGDAVDNALGGLSHSKN